jgi:hypothetical protein
MAESQVTDDLELRRQQARARARARLRLQEQEQAAAPEPDFGAPEPQLVSGLRAPEQPMLRPLESARKAAAAYPGSAAKVLSDTVKGIYQLATSPAQTTMGVLDVAAGALRNMAPAGLRKFLDSASDPATIERIQAAAQKAGGAFAERYGSNEAIVNTLETDPAGAMSDIATILGIGGAAAPGRVGTTLTKASRVADLPVTAAVGGLDLLAATPGALLARPERRASKMLQQSLGPERFALEDALKRYPHLPPAEAAAAAGIVAPEFFAAAQESNRLNVGNVFARRVANVEDLERNALAQMAGGGTQTSARGAAAAQKSALEARLGPVREQELRAANIAGQKLPELEAQERAFGDVAAAKVEDVRRFTAAGERAAAREAEAGAIAVRSKGLMASQQADQYAHMGELAGAADRVAESAAQGSLLFGEARRFAKAAKDSLEAHGLRPLRAEEATRSIDDMLADPRFAGSADVRRALTQVKADLAAWTNQDGVIDAFALDSIRKNSVNAAVRDALGTSPMSAKQQKRLTAELTASIKPLIVDAIERAGGTGYGQYLRDYASGLHTVSQRKMGAKLLKQYQSNPKKFQEIVRGDDPALIEKTFGPGSYDIAAEMAPHIGTLRTISQRLERLDTIKDQAEKGRRGMELIAELNQSKLKLPNWLNPKVALTNAALQGLEKYTDPRTRTLLAEALQSGKSAQELLNKVPIAERGRIFTLIGQSITKLEPYKVSTVGRSANALASKEESVNALAPEDEE